MIKQIGNITLRIIAAANLAAVAVMLLIGYSDRVNPADHALVANVGLAFPVFLFINFCFLVFFLIFKKRYALVSILGFVAGYAPIRKYCPLNVGREVPAGAIKVLSYNVHMFLADNAPEGEPNPILQYVINSDADIVCLQEAHIDKRLEEAVKGVYDYMDSVINRGRDVGLVVLSKYPITAKERIKYKSVGNLSGAFTVNIDGEEVVVVNNHFETSGLSPEDRAAFKEIVKGHSDKDTIRKESKRLVMKLGEAARIRAPQAETVAGYVRNCGKPVILCGDFNDSPISYAHHTLDKVLTDCYIATGNGPGISYHHNAIFVRIDNIMCSEHWQPYGCKVDRSCGYSDHYPIYCWLEKTQDDKNKRQNE